MAYQALYRKWRPAVFSDVRGQDPIVKTLRNQVLNHRVGHAYIFSGTRGTGKTTVAKILSRAVNCENPQDGSPCNVCPACRAILNGTSVNVSEIDAASNNGIDSVREIREEVKYRPTEGKYRVYIIDEVHQLTAAAFNALLKTLEEPPEYVIFILATTDPEKVPITVLSRCQRYDFRRLSLAELEKQISDILKAENVECEPAAVSYIAKMADGSSRDGLSILEQCVSYYYGEKLTYERVLDVLGAVDQSVFSTLLKAVNEQDMSGVIAVVDDLLSRGREISQFITDFIWYLRNLLLLQTETLKEETIGVSHERLLLMQEEARGMETERVMRDIRLLSELGNRIRYAVSKRVLLEMTLLRMMMPSSESDTESLRARVANLEDKVLFGKNNAIPAAVIRETADEAKGISASVPEPETIEVPEALFEDYEKLAGDWNDILGQLTGFARSVLIEAIPSALPSGLVLLFESDFKMNGFSKNNASRRELEEVLKKKYGKEFHFTEKVKEAGSAAPKIVFGKRIPGIEMDIEG